MAKYREINADQIPANIRFDVPARFQGQVIEFAYGGTGRYEHDSGAPYRRVTDYSIAAGQPGRVTFYKRVGR